MSRAVLLLVFVGGLFVGGSLAGCLQDNLIACGDKSCPTGDVCIAASSRCVRPDQLAACAALDNDAPCLAGGITGRCTDGACTPVSCGNGTIESGEVCDDGNQVSGDGCNGTCSSDELCGNGVVDTAAGEGCDCGSDGAQSALCMHPNSDAAEAECDSACQPRFCGDGFVSTIEQCDGSVPADATCDKFGYYIGDVSCVSCQLSITTCSGRCGDGIVDPDHGEYCEGDVPVGASCIDFGYDLGTLACGSACGPALANCRSLEWERIHSVHAPVLDGWGGHARIGVVYQTGDAWVVVRDAPAQTAQFPATGGPYVRVTGDASEIWAAGPGVLTRWTASSGTFTTETPPWSKTDNVTNIAATADGLFVELGDLPDLMWRRTSSGWSMVGSPCQSGSSWRYPQIDSMGLIVCQQKAFRWDATSVSGTPWRGFATGQQIDKLVLDGTGTFWAVDGNVGGALWKQTGTDAKGDPTFSQISNFVNDVVAGGTGVFFRTEIIDTPNNLYAFTGEHSFSTTLPLGQIQMIGDRTDTPIAAFDTGLYAIDRGVWTAMMSVQDEHQNFHVDDGPISNVDFNGVLNYQDALGQTVSVPSPAACAWGAISTSGKGYCVASDGLYDGATKVTVTGLEWLTAASDDSFAAAVGPSVFIYRDASGWHSYSTTETIYRVAGDAADDLWMIASESSGYRVLHWDGNALTKVASTPEPAIVVSASSVNWLGAGTLVTYDRAANMQSSSPAPAGLVSLANGHGKEIWAAVGGFSPEASPLWRFDGASWTPVRVPMGVQVVRSVDSFQGDPVIRTPGGFGGDPVYRLARTGAW